jgi:hypothetical protein
MLEIGAGPHFIIQSLAKGMIPFAQCKLAIQEAMATLALEALVKSPCMYLVKAWRMVP